MPAARSARARRRRPSRRAPGGGAGCASEAIHHQRRSPTAGRGDPGARRQLGAFPGLARQRAGAASSAASSCRPRTPQACSSVAASLALARSTNMDRRLSKDCDRSRAARTAARAAPSPPGRRATSAAWPAAGPGVPGQAAASAGGDVLGQLAVQESQRIGARGGNDQEIVQGRRRRNLRRWTESKQEIVHGGVSGGGPRRMGPHRIFKDPMIAVFGGSRPILAPSRGVSRGVPFCPDFQRRTRARSIKLPELMKKRLRSYFLWSLVLAAAAAVAAPGSGCTGPCSSRPTGSMVDPQQPAHGRTRALNAAGVPVWEPVSSGWRACPSRTS